MAQSKALKNTVYLEEIATATGASYSNSESEKTVVSGITADSRSVKKGYLFVALTGEKVDGHDYCERAIQSGAAAVLVEKEAVYSKPSLLVNSTRKAAGSVAQCWLAQFDAKKIALTGSSGKTTCKEMLVTALAPQLTLLATQGNLNNDLGVPFTAYRMRTEHELALFEMGTNSAGEISYLSNMVQPDVAILLNIQKAHIGGFKNEAALVAEKLSLFQGLNKNGKALVCLDDDRSVQWIEGLLEQGVQKENIIGFSVCDLAAHNTNNILDLEQCVYIQKINGTSANWEIEFVVLGEKHHAKATFLLSHNRANYIAALATVFAAGGDVEQAAKALTVFQEPSGRGGEIIKNELRIIDDSYNANPSSMAAALVNLNARQGEKYALLGCMGELGEQARQAHIEVGQQLKGLGFSGVWVLGQYAEDVVCAIGGDEQNAKAFETKKSLMTFLKNKKLTKGLVLVKGSRSQAMEEFIPVLLGEQ